MLIRDHMAQTGATLFRWRSFVLLAFAPAIVWAVMQGEQVEAVVGPFWGETFEVFAFLMVALGQLGRILTVGFVPVGTSGRNTGAQRATRLNTTGVYSVVRNPLYLFNCMMYLGVVLYAQSLVLALVLALVLLPYYERIIAAEEAFLTERFGADYTSWAARTPAFIPRLSGFIAPDMPFSWRTVVRREHASVFAAIVVLYAITLGNHWGNAAESLFWLHIVMAVAVVAEVACVFLKKRTTVLDVAGR
jgi:protein-S-isoprenylcysteine O-methyltransferase Ste14